LKVNKEAAKNQVKKRAEIIVRDLVA